jgi:hypothetical protein
MMNLVDNLTSLLGHIVEILPKLISILTSVGDMAQKLADTLKAFGSTK